MFTGIIEALGIVQKLERDRKNLHLSIRSGISQELKIDQSVCHNGVCLTVVSLDGDTHTVTAVEETLKKTNLGGLKVGNRVNLERAMILGGRMDGHIVQGHVDQTATCVSSEERGGSWTYTFQYDPRLNNVTIEKGSITVDGVSLTVVHSQKDRFGVAIVPYTHGHTLFNTYKKGTRVNLEFDVVGKYVARLMEIGG